MTTDIRAGLASMVEAAQSGGDLRSAFLSPTTPEETPVETAEVSEEPQAAEVAEGSAQGTTEEPEAQVASEEDSTDSKKPEKAEDIEEITITDSKGKRKIKIDYSNRDQIKKMVQLAAGARKWQQERDLERKSKAELEQNYTKLQSDMEKLEKAYGEGGVSGIKSLVELLEGKGAFDRLVDEAQAERERWESMDPSERRQVERERELAAERAKASEIEKRYESKLQELTQRQEQAELRTLESKLHPAFDRYRFAGKLGDAVAEHHYDQALWNQAMDRLEKYPENVELTQALIEKEFRNVAQAFNKVINRQVDQKVQKVITKTKENATRQAQAKVSKSMQNSSDADRFSQSLRSGGSGNIASALTALMQGKVKL